jgi:hypothetical protein
MRARPEEACWERPGSEIHHEHYRHVFDEMCLELRLLCRRCHQRLKDEKAMDLLGVPPGRGGG